jgi:hypothetical protein
MTTKRPLMGTDNILELQDNGYKSTVSAISEIIDNSLQADAKNVQIILVRDTTKSDNEIDEILIIDDGNGMNKAIFDKALQMSAGSKTKAKSGLGKYGQGLPNSSISQTKRVEVYTIQDNIILYNHIDLDEIYASGEAFLPNTETRNRIDIPLYLKGKLVASKSGTIVRWVKPNKIRPKTVKTLVSHIESNIGRTFRYFIDGYTDRDGSKYKTKIGVLVFDYNGKTYEENAFTSIKEITPFDPMFLMHNTQMDKLFPDSIHPTSELLYTPDGIKKVFKVEYNGELVNTTVEIRISYCKKEERSRYGSQAGNTMFGRKYLTRNLIGITGYHNISIIRAGREIDIGSFGFITNVSDPTERWWSAEVIVDPIVDSIIGVDNKKQQAANIHYLDTQEVDNSDNEEILRWISTFLDNNIDNARKIIHSQNAGIGSSTTNTKGGLKLPPGGESEVGEPAPLPEDYGDKERNETRREFADWIKKAYPEIKNTEIKQIVEYALGMKDNHIFVKSDLGDTNLYSYKVFGTKVLIEINYTHSFYRRFMQAFEQEGSNDKAIRSIRLLISAMVNSEIVNSTNDRDLLNDRRKIRNRMFESLDDYIEELYS